MKIFSLISILFCLLLIPITLDAQTTFGLRAGAGMNIVSDLGLYFEGSPMYNTSPADTHIKSDIGFSFGLFAEHPINDTFSLVAEAIYVKRGYKNEYVINRYTQAGSNWYLINRINYDSHMSIGFIEIPILIKASRGNISFSTGPSVAFRIHQNYSLKISESAFNSSGTLIDQVIMVDAEGNPTESLKSVIMNLQLGVDYRITESFSLGLRYTIGLTSIEKFYKLTETELSNLATLSEKEREKWMAEHPFIYPEHALPDAENQDSIELSSIHLIIGYNF